MTSFKRTQRKYVQKAYRVRNWREYETGLRARGSLTVWLGSPMASSPSWHERIRTLFPRRGRPAGAESCTHLCEEPR